VSDDTTELLALADREVAANNPGWRTVRDLAAAVRGLESRLTTAEAALAEIGRLDGMYCRNGEGSGEFRRRVHWQLRRLASVSAPEETT
jgi:hypothetical protein